LRILSYGGFIDYQTQLAIALSETETVLIVIPGNKLSSEYFDDRDGTVEIHFLGRGMPLYHPANIFTIIKFLDIMREYRPDIIHMQLGGSIIDLALLFFFKKYPLVSTFHDVKPHAGERNLLPNFIRYWVRKYSNQLLVHGEILRELMIKEYDLPANKVHFIQIGEHEVSPFKKYALENIKEDGNLILFFGRIWKYKGLEYLIKAEPMITKEVPNAKIIIAGVGEDFQKYEKMMVNKDNFIVHNYRITYKEGAELFQRCSLVVLPYIEASQSGVIPTAYGFEKPVIVTDVGSIPEIVDDGVTGFVVPAKDSEALAKAIITLLKDEKLRKYMGKNAYKKLKTDMSWGNIAEKTVMVYEAAIKDAKR
jgi:starch synthase